MCEVPRWFESVVPGRIGSTVGLEVAAGCGSASGTAEAGTDFAKEEQIVATMPVAVGSRAEKEAANFGADPGFVCCPSCGYMCSGLA